MNTAHIVHLTQATEIHVSTTFFPAAVLPGVAQGQRCDIVVQTSDMVFFYCHKSVLLGKSSNSFGSLIPVAFVEQAVIATVDPSAAKQEEHIDPSQLSLTPSVSHGESTADLLAITVLETAAIFNIVLHALYDMPFSRYGPTLDMVSQAVGALTKYGIPAVRPECELYLYLLRSIERYPLQVYSIAASTHLETICLAASEKTLGVSLSKLSEADAILMGPLYLRRLFFLHLGRINALQRVMDSYPEEHQDDPGCTSTDKQRVKHLWRAGKGTLLMREFPQNVSVQDLVLVFGAIIGDTSCLKCRAQIQARIGRLVQDWSRVRRTI